MARLYDKSKWRDYGKSVSKKKINIKIVERDFKVKHGNMKNDKATSHLCGTLLFLK